MTLKFYTSVAKGLKLNVRKISELIPTFVNVTEKKHVGKLAGGEVPHPEQVKRFNSLVLAYRIN